MIRFIRQQPVLCIAALAAILSMIAVPPCAAYADYVDWRVIGLLFGLMLCVAGLRRAGVLDWVASRPLRPGILPMALVLLCFFCSMLVTNDVSLITFVPLTLVLLAGSDHLALVVVLETIAANMGSMLTPVGNPQNLFLYEAYDLGIGPFMAVVWPYAALSLVLLVAAVLLLCRGKGSGLLGKAPAQGEGEAPTGRSGTADLDPRRAAAFGILFLLCVLAVLRLAPVPVTIAVVALDALIIDRDVFRGVDYALLATFVCFFIFSGNLAAQPQVHQALTGLMSQQPFVAGVLASQVISNVPAAVLLQPFTADWAQLLLAVDIGGLGTPVASLASLISLEFYRKAGAGPLGRYMALFLVANGVVLAANICLYLLIV